MRATLAFSIYSSREWAAASTMTRDVHRPAAA